MSKSEYIGIPFFETVDYEPDEDEYDFDDEYDLYRYIEDRRFAFYAEWVEYLFGDDDE